MAVDGETPFERVASSCRCGRRHGQSGRGAEPPGDRYLRANTNLQPVMTDHVPRHPGGQVGSAGRQSRTFPFRRHEEPGGTGLDFYFDI